MKIIENIDAFASEMMSAKPFRNHLVSKPTQTKIIVVGTFIPKTGEGRNAFWAPDGGMKRYRDSYAKYYIDSFKSVFGLEDGSSIDDVSYHLGLEGNELRICLPINSGGRIYLSPEEDDRNMSVVRRTFGYLVAVKKGGYPALDAVAASKVGRGYNSPNRGVTLLTLARGSRCFNPGKLNRAVYAAREAARVKHGYRCSLRTAARAVEVVGVRSPGKAATVAYSSALGLDEPVSYRAARDFVVEVLLAKRRGFKDIDGVPTSLRRRESKGSLKRYEAIWLEAGWRHVKGFLFVIGEDSFHMPHSHGWGRGKSGWSQAIRVLKSRREFRKENLKIENMFSKDSCHLIYMSDSLAAGNCEVGTREFMRKHGLEGQIAPLEQVYKIALGGNNLAMNAVKEAAKHVA
ncbi:MAG: hypothetical protein U9R12_01620 [Candidatus Caldatribacteriota bacterium]|nr:hypothetical protein [Candidatus Caldatribacteriota bacterium]